MSLLIEVDSDILGKGYECKCVSRETAVLGGSYSDGIVAVWFQAIGSVLGEVFQGTAVLARCLLWGVEVGSDCRSNGFDMNGNVLLFIVVSADSRSPRMDVE